MDLCAAGARCLEGLGMKPSEKSARALEKTELRLNTENLEKDLNACIEALQALMDSVRIPLESRFWDALKKLPEHIKARLK